MRYKQSNISRSSGMILCNDMYFGEKHFSKGHKITPEDIIIFKMFGMTTILGAIFEDGDIDYKTALKQVAAQISGTGIGYVVEKDGICRIVSAIDGVFALDKNRLNKFNNFNENIILNTIAPHSLVKKGDVVAELEITTPLVSENDINDMIFKLSGNLQLLNVIDFVSPKAVLVYPHLFNDEAENNRFTSIVMKLITNLNDTGMNFIREISSTYNKDNLADSLFDAYSTGADVVFVLSPLKSSGRDDVIATALKQSVDDIVSYSVPIVGASDFIISQKDKIKVISIPFAYDDIDTSEIDNFIKTAIYKEHLTEVMFNNKQSAELNEVNKISEKVFDKLIMPTKKSSSSQKANIGIVVLAAGQGRRSGASKLLVEDKSKTPLFMYAVNAAIASNAKPVFVITGHRNEEMEEYLSKLDVNVIYNQSYASGIKTSIGLGLKSIPSSCDGAILLPADMPNITATELNKLISKFDITQEKQVCVLTNKGIKNNPVLWSKSLYDKADIVPENAAFRTVFAEHSDYMQHIEIKDKKKLLDINFPNDIKEFSEH
ncbi:MAG: hypothetical protein E7017_06670 [Alphaproteobacteria bacterium]|nr:hypothetical protein [Alphaproteobacteria bacterium]